MPDAIRVALLEPIFHSHCGAWVHIQAVGNTGYDIAVSEHLHVEEIRVNGAGVLSRIHSVQQERYDDRAGAARQLHVIQGAKHAVRSWVPDTEIYRGSAGGLHVDASANRITFKGEI